MKAKLSVLADYAGGAAALLIILAVLGAAIFGVAWVYDNVFASDSGAVCVAGEPDTPAGGGCTEYADPSEDPYPSSDDLGTYDYPAEPAPYNFGGP